MEKFSEAAPLFLFGAIADIQYADLEDGLNYTGTRRRFYRSSLQLVREARASWADLRPTFILQLGDIIDGFNNNHGASERALDTVLAELVPADLVPVEVHHVWGNHELYNFSRSALQLSRLNSSLNTERTMNAAPADRDMHAYSFCPYPGFSFVVLDGYDVSLLGRKESCPFYKEALSLIREHNPNQDLNCPAFEGLEQRFTMFNGGYSKIQLDWLQSLLTSADENKEKVTIVSHLPVHPLSTTPICLAWNYDELLSIIRLHPCVVCFMAGHDHDGGYHQDRDTGVHHLTLKGVIETPPDSNAFATVSVYEDRMELKGAGREGDRIFKFPARLQDMDQS